MKRKSKLTGALLVSTLVLGWLEKPRASLQELVKVSAKLGVRISPAGLHQRLTEATVKLLQGVLAACVQQRASASKALDGVLGSFEGIYLLDSTTIQVPAQWEAVFGGRSRKCGAALKVQCSYEYQSGQLQAVEVTNGSAPDQHCQLHVQQAQAGSLHVFDLGYFDQTVLQKLDAAKAFFVLRLHSQVALYRDEAATQRVDLPALLRHECALQGEFSLYLGHKVALPVRIVFECLPPALAQQRHRKAHETARRRGQTPSQRHLTLQDYGLWLTNVPAERLPAAGVPLLYRLRWQIELLFKLWKSQLCLDAVGHCHPTRLRCQLYARLLGFVLFSTCVAPLRFAYARELSLPKAFLSFQSLIPSLLPLISRAWRGFAPLWHSFSDELATCCLKSRRKKTPSTLQLLTLAGLA